MKRFGQPILAAMLLTSLLTGCSSSSADKLLTPPLLEKEQREIIAALYESADADIELEYPLSGGGSAVLLSDLDGDGEDEAVVFYRQSPKVSEDTSLKFSLLDKKDDEWKSVCDMTADGERLDKLKAEKLGDSGRESLIAGICVKGQNDKQFTVYDYDGEKLAAVFENEPYSLFDMKDLDGDGKKELFTVSAQSQTKVSSAVVYRPDEKGAFQNSSLPLSELYTDYRNISYSVKDGRNTQYVYLDAVLSSGSIMTEVLRYGAGHTIDRVYAPDTENADTLRSADYLCCDIDGDGVAEIPVPHLCRGYDNDSDDPVYFTAWKCADEGSLATVCESYTDTNNGYAFVIPKEWENKVTAFRTGTNGITIAEGNSPKNAKELFTLKAVYGRDMSDKAIENGFEKAVSKGGIQLLVKINKDSGSTLPCTAESINKNLKFMD